MYFDTIYAYAIWKESRISNYHTEYFKYEEDLGRGSTPLLAYSKGRKMLKCYKILSILLSFLVAAMPDS